MSRAPIVPNPLGEVAVLCRLLVDADAEVARVEAELKVAKENAARLREEALPGAMLEIGVAKIELSDGTKIETGLEVYVQLTEETKPAAYRWLDEHGFGGLIKSNLQLSFARDDIDAAKALNAMLADPETVRTLAAMAQTFDFEGSPEEQQKAINAVQRFAEHSGYESLLKQDVNAMTLKAWAKEQLREGKEFPLQLFNARPVTQAKVKIIKT